MFTENRIFKYALITSILVHVFILLVIWITNIQNQKEIEEKIVEIVYRSQVFEEKLQEQKTKHVKSLKEEKKFSLPKILTKRDFIKPEPIRRAEKHPVKLDLSRKSTSRLKGIGEKRQIKIPMLDSDKMMGSRYMTYHEQVRDKIRNRAYFYVNDPDFESGEVYLTFVLASDGELKQVKIIHEKTQANSYLKRVGLLSIKESSPFPPFSKDLDYPELTFNVVISFEMGE